MSAINAGTSATMIATVPEGDELLGVGNATVAAENNAAADKGCNRPIAATRRRSAAKSKESVEDGASREPARPAHEQWRNRFDRDANTEEGRAPDEIDRSEGRAHAEKPAPVPWPLHFRADASFLAGGGVESRSRFLDQHCSS